MKRRDLFKSAGVLAAGVVGFDEARGQYYIQREIPLPSVLATRPADVVKINASQFTEMFSDKAWLKKSPEPDSSAQPQSHSHP